MSFPPGTKMVRLGSSIHDLLETRDVAAYAYYNDTNYGITESLYPLLPLVTTFLHMPLLPKNQPRGLLSQYLSSAQSESCKVA